MDVCVVCLTKSADSDPQGHNSNVSIFSLPLYHYVTLHMMICCQIAVL